MAQATPHVCDVDLPYPLAADAVAHILRVVITHLLYMRQQIPRYSS